MFIHHIQYSFQKRHIYMRLAFEFSFICLLCLIEFIAGSVIDIQQYPWYPGLFEVVDMFGKKGLTAAPDKRTFI